MNSDSRALSSSCKRERRTDGGCAGEAQELSSHLAHWGVPAGRVVIDPLLAPAADYHTAALWQLHLISPATGAAALFAAGACVRGSHGLPRCRASAAAWQHEHVSPLHPSPRRSGRSANAPNAPSVSLVDRATSDGQSLAHPRVQGRTQFHLSSVSLPRLCSNHLQMRH